MFHSARPHSHQPAFKLRPARVAAQVLLLLAVSGCEWVMDGIPRARQGAVVPDGSAWPPPLGDAGSSGDGATAPADGGGVLPVADAGPDPADAGPVAVDAGPPCVPGRTVYRDVDRDGYGTGIPQTLTCPSPFGFSEQTGDCDDTSADVFPGQTRYFGTPYKASDGSQSFDYDCSGAEDGNGRQTVLGSCGLLGAAFCTGKGYAPGDRFPTFGINTACGSTLVQECKAELLGTASCRASAGVKSDPYVCR